MTYQCNFQLCIRIHAARIFGLARLSVSAVLFKSLHRAQEYCDIDISIKLNAQALVVSLLHVLQMSTNCQICQRFKILLGGAGLRKTVRGCGCCCWCSALTSRGIRSISFRAHYVIKLTSELSSLGERAVPQPSPATQIWHCKFAWQIHSLAPSCFRFSWSATSRMSHIYQLNYKAIPFICCWRHWNFIEIIPTLIFPDFPVDQQTLAARWGLPLY